MRCSKLSKYRKLRKCAQKSYPTYPQILGYQNYLNQIYPNNSRLETIGFSSERRPIHMIILQEHPNVPKQGIMIESGIHAREWVTHTTALYIADFVAQKQSLLKYMDFYIIPCINPDGYEYSHTNRRLWRKNMNRNGKVDRRKWGVDLNRNFPIGFGGTGSSEHQGSSKYRGRSSLSEPESRILSKTITKYAHCIKLYVSLHCYGESIMYPWGYTKEKLEDMADLHDCATLAQLLVKHKFNDSNFKVGQLSKIKYVASGITIDYVRSVHNVKFVFSIELPKGGTSGFNPLPAEILPIAQKVMTIIASMVKYVTKYFEDNKVTVVDQKQCCQHIRDFCSSTPREGDKMANTTS